MKKQYDTVTKSNSIDILDELVRDGWKITIYKSTIDDSIGMRAENWIKSATYTVYNNSILYAIHALARQIQDMKG